MAKPQFNPRTRPYGNRKVGTRPEKKRILIICGGETEKLYFDQFRPAVKPRIFAKGIAPDQLVEWAENKRDSEKDIEAVWCVFDCDDFGRRYDEAHRLAQNKGFKVAASNPCFELWFVLHYREIHQRITTANCQTTLKKLLKKPYEKTDSSIFFELEPNRPAATTRARQMTEKHTPKASGAVPNPGTGVHLLLEALGVR